MVQGRLYLNNVLHRIDPGENDGKFTFCKLSRVGELRERGIGEERAEFIYYINLADSESLTHLFWECDHVQNLIQKVYRWVMGWDWVRGGETISKKDFMMGKWMGGFGLTQCDIIWKHMVKFLIYQCRGHRKLPVFGNIIHELMGLRLGTTQMQWENYIERCQNVIMV